MGDLDLLVEADVRGALVGRVRSALRGVLRMAGDVYQPLYVGPLEKDDALWGEVERQAAAQKMEALRGFDAWRAMGYQPAVVLMSIDDAKAYGRLLRFRCPPGNQVIVWGNDKIDDVSADIRDWVQLAGMAVEPEASDVGVEALDEEVREVFARLGVGRGVPYNPIVLVVEEGQRDVELKRARLRLEASGWQTTDTFGTSQAIVRSLAMSDEDVVSCAEHASRHLEGEERVPLVLVGTRDDVDRARSYVLWRNLFHRGVVLRLDRDTMVEGDVLWPSLSEVLQRGISVGQGDPKADRMWTEWSDEELPRIVDVLQSLNSRVRPMAVLVYGPDRFARIVVNQGEIRRFDISGDEWDDMTLARRRANTTEGNVEKAAYDLAIERLWRVLHWGGSDMLLMRVNDEGEARDVQVDAVISEAFGGQDDSRPRRAGLGPRAVWQVRAGNPGGLEVRLAKVLECLDGVKTLYEVAQELGFLPLEMAGAIDLLARRELVVLLSEGQRGTGDGTAELLSWAKGWTTVQVASELLRDGMVRNALELLGNCDDQKSVRLGDGSVGGLDVEGLFTYAYALAATEGASVTAARAFSRAWDAWERRGLGEGVGETGQLVFDRWLDVAIVQGRSGSVEWPILWRHTARELKAGCRGAKWGIRQHLAAGELALRGGDMRLAMQAAERLASLGIRPRWVIDLVGSESK